MPESSYQRAPAVEASATCHEQEFGGVLSKNKSKMGYETIQLTGFSRSTDHSPHFGRPQRQAGMMSCFDHIVETVCRSF